MTAPALTLTVLGCSGTYAGPGNACSGYLVSDGATSVWLDCGPGTLANLQLHASLAELDAVVVTHSHPDHWLELPVLRNALKYGFDRSGVPVFGTAETHTRLEAALGESVAPTFDWRVISDGATFSVGTLSFTCSRTDHPVETMAVRVDSDDDRTLVYSADTGAGWSPTRLGDGIDLALLEATLLAHQEGMAPHLSARQAGALAREAGARRLIITHVWPTSPLENHRREAEEAFGAPVEVATINMRYEI